jgi:cyclohexadienyl dehydratase
MVRLLAVLTGLLLATSPASAQERTPVRGLDAILVAGVLRVGTTGDYRPFTFKDPGSGQFSGLDIDLARSLADALGIKLAIVPTTWPTLSADFDAGKFDVAMGGVSVTYDRQKRGLFSAPYMREGKTPIARCGEKAKFDTLAEIDKPDVTVIANPGGTNEKFDRAHLKEARIVIFPDNTKIFDEVAAGHADLMITDASETRFQEKLHRGVLCAIHPDKPFDFAEKAYWLQRDIGLKDFVDLWLHQSMETGAYQKIYDKWFE